MDPNKIRMSLGISCRSDEMAKALEAARGGTCLLEKDKLAGDTDLEGQSKG